MFCRLGRPSTSWKWLLFYTLLVCRAPIAEAVGYLNASQGIVYRHFWDLEFQKGHSLLHQVSHQHPHDPYNLMLRSFGTAIELLVETDRYHYLRTKYKESQWLDSLSDLEDSPQKRYCQAVVKLHWALVKSVYGDGLSAAWSIKQAYGQLGELYGRYPDFHPCYVYYGTLNVALSNIPENYQWAAQLAGLIGKEAKGLQLLEQAAANGDANLALETNIALMFLENHLEYPRDKILARADQLRKRGKGLDLVGIMTAWLYNRNSASDMAKAQLETLHTTHAATLRHYMTGIACFQLSQWEEAKKHLQQFLKTTKGANLKKDVLYKLAQVADIQEDTVLRDKYVQRIKRSSGTLMFADKYAALMVASYPFKPTKLLKGKIHFEGGRFQESLAELQSFVPSSPQNTAEKYYYMGKAALCLGDFHLAQSYFKTSIEASPKDFYIGPLSSLTLAKAFLVQGRSQEAVAYARKISQFKNYDFKKGIQEKASKIQHSTVQ